VYVTFWYKEIGKNLLLFEMLVKLTAGVNFILSLRAAFSFQSVFAAFL